MCATNCLGPSLVAQQCGEGRALAQLRVVLQLPRELERSAAEVVRDIAQRACVCIYIYSAACLGRQAWWAWPRPVSGVGVAKVVRGLVGAGMVGVHG